MDKQGTEKLWLSLHHAGVSAEGLWESVDGNSFRRAVGLGYDVIVIFGNPVNSFVEDDEKQMVFVCDK